MALVKLNRSHNKTEGMSLRKMNGGRSQNTYMHYEILNTVLCRGVIGMLVLVEHINLKTLTFNNSITCVLSSKIGTQGLRRVGIMENRDRKRWTSEITKWVTEPLTMHRVTQQRQGTQSSRHSTPQQNPYSKSKSVSLCAKVQ